MSFINDNKVYITVALFVIIVIVYYLIDYQIKNTLFSELRKIGEKKTKKIKLQKIKQQKIAQKMKMKQQYSEEHNDQENQQQYDMDSYIDPATKYTRHEEEDGDEEQEMRNRMQQERLSKDNIYMRDIMDK